MNDTKTEPKLESWSVAEAPFVIEYPASTLNEIRAYVAEAMRRLSRGGLEEGGVLFGASGENLVRILTWRPITCEHVSGPAFQLSQNDRIALGQVLHTAKTDNDLTGLHPVGWFVAHSRAGVSLTETDLKLYNHFFPWSWQVTLVLQPSRQGSAKAGFFFRDAQGEIKADAPYQEFTIEPGAIPPPAPISRAIRNETAASEHTPPIRTPEVSRQYQPETRERPHFADRRLWIWAVPLLLALLVGAMLIDWPVVVQPRRPSLAFRVADAGGELRLEWDKNAEPIRDAVRGMLDIQDGSRKVQVPLNTSQLRAGQFNYRPESGDVKLGLTVYPANGAPVQESARFLGSLSNAKEDAAQLRRQRDDLTNEVNRLREDLRKLSNRNRELEDAVRILENRVQVENLQRPAPTSPTR